MLVVKSLISITIAAAGLYCLLNFKSLSRSLQEFYIRQATGIQKEKGLSAYLPGGDPKDWRGSFAKIFFRVVIIFLGIWLIIASYPIVFGGIQL